MTRCGDTENWDDAEIGMRETALSRNGAERHHENGDAAKGVNPRGFDLSGVGARKRWPVIRASGRGEEEDRARICGSGVGMLGLSENVKP